MTHGDLDALEDFIDKKEKPLSEPPFTNGSPLLSFFKKNSMIGG